jgi:hypothetical protein
MRQMISGLLTAAALTIAGAAPAMACGYGGCAPCGVYGSPCGQPYAYDHVGWGFERLPDPELQYHSVERAPQYYYVNQGPTFTGPGAFAPLPAYPVGGWNVYTRYPRYGYVGPRAGSYRWRRHYNFRPHRYSYYHGRPILRRYD